MAREKSFLLSFSHNHTEPSVFFTTLQQRGAAIFLETKGTFLRRYP
jgi:hypothetical protein